MNPFRILHTTDWHINDPSRKEEKLRKGFFRDYINGLHKKVSESGLAEIDLLICSGDFIDRGKCENFSHAKDVLDYLAKKFSIPNDRIVLTMGNHDIKVLDHKKGDFSAFQTFAADYGPHKIISHTNICKIAEYSNKIFLIELNSILNEAGEIHTDPNDIHVINPSQISDADIDQIVTTVEEVITNAQLLIIVTHFPMSINNRMAIITEENNWVKKHLWTAGKEIMQRITNNRLSDNIVCLYGDGHSDNYWSASTSHHYFMTGMFGGNYLERTYVSNGETISFEKTNDARILEFKNWKAPDIYTFSYYPVGSKYSPHSGAWGMEPGAVVVEEKTSIYYPQHTEKVVADPMESKIDVISQQIQENIIEIIKAKNLYFFARTVTSPTESSLGWVSISSLFEAKGLLSASNDKIYEWLSKQSAPSNTEDCILIGMGFWGGILASQLNARRNNKCFLVSSRRIPNNTNYFESIDYVIDSIRETDFNEIVIVTDVISTGNSILRIKEKITLNFGNKCKKFIAISVLSDKNQQRLQQLNEFDKIGSLCINMPIPVIDNDKLPDESIFPIEYDFR
jgi:hypoxanthine-guanine phosphoribosyltransferase